MRKIMGPDVSFYQDAPNTPQGINFVRMNQATDFVIIRAGQHLGADSDFKTNWTQAKAAGLPRGSYWFYDSRADPKRQAELWFSLFDGDLGELPLFADIEEAYGGPFTGWPHWKTFLDRIKALVGNKEVAIYTAFFYWCSNAPNPTTQPAELEYFHRYPLWIANYNVTQPQVPQPWSANEWLFWQYTSSGDGLFYGVESLEIDLNNFNGDAQAFADRFNVPVPPDPVPPEDPTGNRYRVTAGTLNVREGPGTNFRVIGSYARNDIVETLASNMDGSWFRVRRLSDGLAGWVSAAYLVKISPPPPPSGGDQYRVNANTLYAREGPGTNYRAVGFFVRNDIVEELEANSDRTWLRVRRLSDGLTGWSSATYLVKITPPPPPPPGSGDQYRVNADSLYVREGPGTTYPTVGYLVRNNIVEELEANSDRTWLRVRRLTDGLTGWCSARYLVRITSTFSRILDGQKFRVTATRLHIREGPGTEYTSLGFVELNEIVTQLSANADESWRRIQRSDRLIGWSSGRYLVPYEAPPPPDPDEPSEGDWYQVTATSL